MAEEKEFKCRLQEFSWPCRLLLRMSVWVQALLFMLFVIFGWLVIRIIQGLALLMNGFSQCCGYASDYDLIAKVLLGAFARGQGWHQVAKTLNEIFEEEEKEDGNRVGKQEATPQAG